METGDIGVAGDDFWVGADVSLQICVGEERGDEFSEGGTADSADDGGDGWVCECGADLGEAVGDGGLDAVVGAGVECLNFVATVCEESCCAGHYGREFVV